MHILILFITHNPFGFALLVVFAVTTLCALFFDGDLEDADDANL